MTNDGLGLRATNAAFPRGAATPALRPGTVADIRVELAERPLGVDVAPRISWRLESDLRGSAAHAVDVRVEHRGAEIWRRRYPQDEPLPTLPSVECPIGLLESDTEYDVVLVVETEDGTAESSTAFRTGFLRAEDWHDAAWIGGADDSGAAPLLRAEFDVPAGITGARLYLAAGGFVRVLIDGAPASDEVLGPGITAYDHRVQYLVWDVAATVRPGRNAIGVELGRGFFGMTDPNIWAWDQAPWNAAPCVRLVLVVDDEHGTTTRVLESGSRFSTTSGPTRYDDLYGGETFDARLEPPGWSEPGFDDRAWSAAVEVPGPAGRLVHRRQQPIRVIETVPGRVLAEADGRLVLDFGRVLAGWVRVEVEGPAGHRIDLRYGEKLTDDGRPNDDDPLGYYSGRFQHDVLTLRGGPGLETWEARFGWKGFRYVEVTGWPGGTPAADAIVARLAHTDVAVTGSFASSEPTLDGVHALTVRTILNNLHSIPTDTPKYEKNGWTADGMLGTEMFLLNLDAHELLAKWVDDIADSRDELGVPRVIAPHGGWTYDWTPAPPWHSAYVLIPWWLYRYNGDTRVLAEHIDGILGYLDVEFARSPGGIATSTLGDWVTPETSPGGGNPPEDLRVPATAYLYAMLATAAAIARVLDRQQDAQRLEGRATIVREAFLREFFDDEAGLVRGVGDAGFRQSHNLLALAHGLIPLGDRQRVADRVADDVRSRDIHLNTGALATKVLLPVLTEFGHAELALALARQRTFPSWGYWLEHGATTLWEHWHEDARSHGHFFLGTVDEWFFTAVAGIELQDVGYRRFTVHPRVIGSVAAASGSVATVFGEIRVEWEVAGGRGRLAVTVPVGTTAELVLPVRDAAEISEGGVPVAATGLVITAWESPQGPRIELPSGRYEFVFPLEGGTERVRLRQEG